VGRHCYRKEKVSNLEELVMEEVLGFCALVLTMLGLISIAVWFCCSTIERMAKMRRRLKSSRYNALLKENKRLKSFLADVEKENSWLRDTYYSERIHHRRAA
jgi:hypothetical protein